MTEVLDYYAVQNRATLQCFKDGGATGIAHYLTASISDPREINRQELVDALAVGLEIFLMFEMNPTYPGYFTFAQGVQDAIQAEQRLKDIGAPENIWCARCGIRHGFIVRFTVDANIDPAITTPYFNGIASVATPIMYAGGYGYQRFCEFAFENFPTVGKHLWQTYGTPTVPLDLWQHLQQTRCDVEVDVNEASIPGWKEEDDMAAADVIAAIKADPDLIAALYEVLGPTIQKKVVAPQVDTDLAEKAVEARIDATVKSIQENIAKLGAAEVAESLTDQHIAGVVLATMRGVFDGVSGDMPKPPFVQ